MIMNSIEPIDVHLIISNRKNEGTKERENERKNDVVHVWLAIGGRGKTNLHVQNDARMRVNHAFLTYH